MRRRGRRSK